MSSRTYTRLFALLAALASLFLTCRPVAGRAVDLEKELPSWHIFFQTGTAPERVLYIVDARYHKISDNVYQTQALVMRETPKGDFDHWTGTLQYQATPEQVELARGPVESLQPLMSSVKVRTLSSYQMRADGKVVPGQPTEWSAFKTPIDLLGFRIATDPKATQRSAHYTMTFTGNFHRPIDVVDLVRRVLPNVKEIQPSSS